MSNKVINKRAMFSVRFAKNLKNKSSEERDRVLSSLSPEALALVRSAIRAVARADKEKANG
jgi:hypothetical protein